MKHWSHLNSAREILQTYTGEYPFNIHLKKFFSADKKYGSKDRRHIGQLCYGYFRLGRMYKDWPMDQRILLGWAIGMSAEKKATAEYPEEWLQQAEKLKYEPLPVQDIFPWKDQLSNGIDHRNYCESFVVQPDLFIRIRPGKEKITVAKIKEAGLDFQLHGNSCIALPNGTRVEKVIDVDVDAVIQDFNSQATGEWLPGLRTKFDQKKLQVWDCCAASGGKSILAWDLMDGIELTVSDIRESIMFNLAKRFKIAGIAPYHSMVTDLAIVPDIPNSPFQLIIADLPCTGSGTWGRTPEQLSYFDQASIEMYASRQKQILSQVVTKLAPKGYLLYITCSVFHKENEEVIAYAQHELHMEVVESTLLKGYDKKADTMFVALLRHHS
jgi:16S rRNA (cytosine967-C5)-methyltransferase